MCPAARLEPQSIFSKVLLQREPLCCGREASDMFQQYLQSIPEEQAETGTLVFPCGVIPSPSPRLITFVCRLSRCVLISKSHQHPAAFSPAPSCGVGESRVDDDIAVCTSQAGTSRPRTSTLYSLCSGWPLLESKLWFQLVNNSNKSESANPNASNGFIFDFVK